VQIPLDDMKSHTLQPLKLKSSEYITINVVVLTFTNVSVKLIFKEAVNHLIIIFTICALNLYHIKESIS